MQHPDTSGQGILGNQLQVSSLEDTIALTIPLDLLMPLSTVSI
ncbi:hypothetical protein [Flavobacterium sp.]